MFHQAMNACICKFATFRGRASRPEFFWFVGAFYAFVTIAYWFDAYVLRGLLTTLAVGLVLACPVLAVFWRRFQDAGLYGWIAPSVFLASYLAAFAYWHFTPDDLYSLPFQRTLENASWLIPVLIALLPSQPGPNKYGPQPNEVPQ